MRVIKLFEEFNNEEDIHRICRKYGIENYTINDDGSIDVDDDVYLNDRLKELPLNFNKVSGNFDCSGNFLTSLKGSPKEVGECFDCSNNRLTSLIGSPKRVDGYFDCSNNTIWSLEGCPVKIGENFFCNDNPVYQVWGLIYDKEYLEIFLDYDMIDGENLYLARLNDILKMMGMSPVTKVKGYRCI